MKRFIFTFLFTLCAVAVFGVVKAQACVVPLMQDENGALVQYYEEDISMENFMLEMRPTEGNSYAATMEFAVKNTSDMTKSVTFGVTKYFYATVTQITNFSMRFEGILTKTKLSDIKKNPSLQSGDPYYPSMYAWTVDIDAGETAFFRTAFSVDTRSDRRNTEFIDVPLKALRFWGNGQSRIKLVLDSALLNVYSYEKTPSMEISKMEDTGALIWEREEFDGSVNLSVSYNYDFSVIARYFTNVFTSGIEKQASDLFRLRKFGEAIKLIDENEALANNMHFRFMKMVCCEKLGKTEDAKALLNELYSLDVCFSSNSEFDLSEYAKKRMIFDYYSNAKSAGTSGAVLNEILTEGIKALTSSRSSVFMAWVDREKAGNPVEDDDVQNNVSQIRPSDIPGQSGDLTVKQWFAQLSQPAVLTVGLALVVVVLYCIVGMQVEKNKKRGSQPKHPKR